MSKFNGDRFTEITQLPQSYASRAEHVSLEKTQQLFGLCDKHRNQPLHGDFVEQRFQARGRPFIEGDATVWVSLESRRERLPTRGTSTARSWERLTMGCPGEIDVERVAFVAEDEGSMTRAALERQEILVAAAHEGARVQALFDHPGRSSWHRLSPGRSQLQRLAAGTVRILELGA